MVSNIIVLEKVKTIDPLVAVIESMNETLKQAASLIQAYRKQGAIARRLNMSNGQNFTLMAQRITACSQDLMLSLQIQQTGDLSILTRAVPIDPQDEEAKQFVQSHGGQNIINVSHSCDAFNIIATCLFKKNQKKNQKKKTIATTTTYPNM